MADEPKLGIAKGVIDLIVNRFEASAAIVQKTSRQTAKVVEGIGEASAKASQTSGKEFARFEKLIDRAMTNAEKSAKKAKAGLEGVGKGTETTRKSSESLTATLTTLVGRVQNIDKVFGLVNEEIKTTGEEMQKTAAQAEKTGSSFDRLAKAAERYQQAVEKANKKPFVPKMMTTMSTAGTAPEMGGLRRELDLGSSLRGRAQMAFEDIQAGVSAKITAAQEKINAGFARIRQNIELAKTKWQEFGNTNLGKLQNGLNLITQKLQMVSAAAGIFAGFGLKAANDIQRLERQFGALLGSQEKATKEMAKLRKFADQMKLPFTQVLDAATQLTPLVKSTGAEFDKLLLITSKLATLDPAQGIQGSRIALSEFLSGDVMSLSRRFELGVPKSAFKEIVQSANGDVNAMLDGLDEIIAKAGITTEAMQQMADPFAVLTDEVKQAADTAFRPLLLEVIIPMVKQFTEFLRNLRETNPEILKIGAGVTVIVAALAPLSAALSGLISLWKGISVAAAAAGISMSGAGKALMARAAPLLKGGLAAAGGAALGLGVAQVAANAGARSGDLGRIANGEDAGAVLVERLKQILVIVVDGFLHFGKVLAYGVLFIGNAIDQFANVFRLAGATFGVVFGEMKKTFGNLMIGLADALSGLFDTTNIRESGRATVGDANNQINTSAQEGARIAGELSRGFAIRQSDIDRVENNMAALRDSVLGGLTDLLFPVEKKAEEVAESLGDAGSTVAQAIGDSAEYLEQQRTEIADATQKYNDEIIQLETDKQERILDLNNKYVEDQVKLAEDYAEQQKKILADMNNDLTKLATDARRDEEKDQRSKQRKEQDNAIKFQRAEVDDAVKHRDKLLKIQNDSQKKREELAAEFDFAGMFAASQDAKDAVDAENVEFQKQQGERSLAMQRETEDMNRDFVAQHEERVIALNQARTDRMNAYTQERADLEQQNQVKRAQLQTNLNNEIAATNAKYSKELEIRRTAYMQELTLLMQTEAQRKQIMLQTQQALIDQAYSFMKRTPPTTENKTPLNPFQQSVSKSLDVMRAQEKAGVQRIGVGGNQAGRAYGGYVSAGRAYPVNEAWSSQMERFATSMGSVALPGAGTFIPERDGYIDPQRGGKGGVTISAPITINGNVASEGLSVNEILRLIQEGAESVLAQTLGRFADER